MLMCSKIPKSQKISETHLTTFFNAVFHVLLEFVFIFFLSCLELEKLELKDLATLLFFSFQSLVAS